MSDFWSQVFKGVGALINTNQREFVFVDDADIANTMLDPASAQSSSPSAPSMQARAKADLDSLVKADPNFVESDFLAQASKAYATVLAAEGAMDPQAAAAAITPAFLAAFQQHLNDLRNGGFTRTVDQVQLDAPTTMRVSIGEQEAIVVRFTGEARRFTTETMTNLVTDGSATQQSFTEFVTFVRPAGSTTPKSAADGAPTHCPSCGAPVDAGALRCSFCGAPLTGTGGTWLIDHVSASAYT